MPNKFAEKPELAGGFGEEVTWDTIWTCPITGFQVPKHPVRNLQWRAELLEAAEYDPQLQQDIITACSQSLLFYINAFAFTIRVFEPGESGANVQATDTHIPYVTWRIQDHHLLWIEHKIDVGESGLTDKSRDMGATWDHLVVYSHRFLYRSDESHLLLSRNERSVDLLDGLPRGYPHGTVADPGTLFGKIDYILSRLPEWMLPRMSRKKMHLVNLDNKTRIDGESANATAGSSDRRRSIFMDEMAKMQYGESIKRSTRDVSACRLVCSTPNGAGTAYSKWRLSGSIEVFILPWWEHPEKGRGRYCTYHEGSETWEICSPWYDVEKLVRSPKELAIELNMDHVGSGDTFFEETVLEEHRKRYARKARSTRTIDFKQSVADEAIPRLIADEDREHVVVTPGGPWRIWVELFGNRLDQTKNYVMGIDISKGQGASNSVISVMCLETREKVAEFACANTPPYTLARIACAAALWVGGRRGLPFVAWENNGDPGFDFGRTFVHTYAYTHIYFDRMPGTIAQKRGKRYGWRSDQEAKAAALGLLRRAYAHGGWITYAHESIDEAASYVHYDSGGIGPAELVEESASARKTHGDRVIADMLCLIAAGDNPIPEKKDTRAPEFSIGGRMNAWKREQRRRKSGDTFQFTTTGGLLNACRDYAPRTSQADAPRPPTAQELPGPAAHAAQRDGRAVLRRLLRLDREQAPQPDLQRGADNRPDHHHESPEDHDRVPVRASQAIRRAA